MRVLVVEDDPDVGEDLASALSEAGFVVDLAAATVRLIYPSFRLRCQSLTP